MTSDRIQMESICGKPQIRLRNGDEHFNENEKKYSRTNARTESDAPASPTDVVQTSDDTEVKPMIVNNPDDDTLKAFDLYRKKKLLTQSMMDIALFSANANQLRNVLDINDGRAISYICIGLLLVSIALQILVGMIILLSIQYNVTNCEERKMAFKYNNIIIVGIFLITVVNVFISAFGGPATHA